jgi:eukaryotic-like serine/threonine-protein kinase
MSMTNHADSSPNVGDHLGRYRLVAQLGQGGMGTIHLAVTSGLGEFRKLLVVKELQRELAQNEKFVEMFMAEAKLAARLNHPNIVQTLEAAEESGRYFLSMEFLDGQPLTALLKRASADPVVPLGMRLKILCEVLAGLQYAHELRDFDGTPFEIVHRDINPQNVFLTYHGQVKLVDFGIAKAVDVDSLTTAGVFKGKFAYAAPEQVRADPVDARSDLFAVGVMLWEVIALRRFASGPATRLAMDKRLAGGEPRIREAVPNVEPMLAEICDRALQVDPDKRFASAAEFREALEGYLYVSGEAPSEPLGALMCAKFAAERAAMHRTIDDYVKREDLSRSVVRSLSDHPPTLPAASEPTSPQRAERGEGVTQVGDLSRWIESSRIDNPIADEPYPPTRLSRPSFEGELPVEWAGALRGRRRIPVPVIAAAGAVTLAGFFWMRANTDTSDTPASPGAVAASSAPIVSKSVEHAATSSPSAESAPLLAPVASAPTLPPPVTAPPDAPSAPTEGSAETRAVRAGRARTDATAPEADAPAPRARASALPRPSPLESAESTAARTRALAASSPAPVDVARTPLEARAERSASAFKGQSGSRQSTTGVEVAAGEDLRELPMRRARPIDTEDPFQ